MGLVYIAVGGALGAVARWSVAGWVQQATGGTFPWGTFAVNVLGAFLLGFAFLYMEQTVLSADLRRFLTVGFLGAFTTFSTFSYETVTLLQDGEWSRATLYCLGSVVCGLVGVLAGAGAATALVRGGMQ